MVRQKCSKDLHLQMSLDKTRHGANFSGDDDVAGVDGLGCFWLVF